MIQTLNHRALQCAYCHEKFGDRKYRMTIESQEQYEQSSSYAYVELANGSYCKPECLRKAIDLVVIE